MGPHQNTNRIKIVRIFIKFSSLNIYRFLSLKFCGAIGLGALRSTSVWNRSIILLTKFNSIRFCFAYWESVLSRKSLWQIFMRLMIEIPSFIYGYHCTKASVRAFLLKRYTLCIMWLTNNWVGNVWIVWLY